MSLQALPSEIIVHLIEFLNFSDRQSLALTCQRLHDICCENETSIRVHLKSVESDSNIFKFSTSWRVSNIVLESQNIDIQRPFWFTVDHRLRRLELHDCSLDHNDLLRVLSLCPQLSVLHLVNCSSIFITGDLFKSENDFSFAKGMLGQLKELSLASNRYLTDHMFDRLLDATSQVESLSLANCPIAFHPAIHRRFYPASVTGPSSAVFTFRNVLKYLSGRGQSIKRLDLSQTLIDGPSLIELANTPGIILEELLLASCDQLNTNSVIHLCRHQPSLRTLDLSQWVKCSEQVVANILLSLTHLKHLYLRACHSVSTLPFTNLQLRSLNLSGCEKLESSSIQQILSDGGLSGLTWLCVDACPLDEGTVIALANFAPQLRHLDLSSCRMGVTDSSLRVICLKLPWLRTLKIAWCDQITDYGLGLEHPRGTTTLASAKGLRHLDLSACTLLSDAGFRWAIKFLELSSLNLSLCRLLTDDGLLAIGAANRSLEKLILAQCPAVTDVGVATAVAHLPRLKHIDLQGCKLLTDSCLTSLLEYCQSLRYLDVSMCLGITREGVQNFTLATTRLCTVHKRHIDPR